MIVTDRTSGVDLPQDDLLVTKLFRPAPRRDLVHRPRLANRLTDGLTGPITVVVAPAGWGKTSLLAGWLATQEQPGPSLAWLALDQQDNDLARFLRYMIGAVQSVRPELGQGALARLNAAQPPTAESVLTHLVNELATLPEDLVLVLDDYHWIETPVIHQTMAFLLDHLSPRLHVVIATRHNPPLPLARLRARGHLVEIRAADLAFTEEEAARFLNDVMGLNLTPNDVGALENRTEGWIAGLHLAALTLVDRTPEQRHDFIASLSGTHRYILDYLAGEVFERQEPEVQRFLLFTSILGGLSGPLCAAVLADHAGGEATLNGQAMLEFLDDANLFVIRLDDTRTWYRYHHLFAGFLHERLRRERPDLIPELHQRAARWLEENGRPEYAAEHALRAEDFEEAARLVERVIGPMIWRRGEVGRLRRWLERLPREVTRVRPRLSLDLAWVLLWSAQIDAIEPRLQDTEQALCELPEANTQALRGEVAAIRAELARQSGEIDTAIGLARRALADLPPDARRVRAATSGLLGQALLLQGDANGASHAFADAAELGRAPETLTLALIALGRLLQTQVLQSRLDLAAGTYHQTLALAQSIGMADAPAIGVAQVYMAEALREWSDLSGAEALVREGIAHCTEWPGLADMALDGYLTLARLLQERGDVESALAALSTAEALGREAHVFQYAERLALARVRLWLATDDDDALRRWIRTQGARWKAEKTLGSMDLLERTMLARLHLMRGEASDSLAGLNGLVEFAEAGGLMRSATEILLLRALSFRGQGQTAQAMMALARALSLAEPQGYVRLFVDEGPRMVELLRQARSRGVAPEYVDTLLASGASPATAARKGDVPVDPLSNRELELLRLLAAGLSTSEIAGQLFITIGTARNHLKNIYGKLDVHGRVQAIERARALNML